MRLLFVLMLAAVSVFPGRLSAGEVATPHSFILRQQLEGEISDFDATARKLRLKTRAGRLALDSPAAGPKTFKKGDSVVVDVAVIRHAEPTRLARSDDGVQPLLSQRVRGSIVGIQRSLGILNVNTSAGRIALELPAKAIAGLRTGDELFLDIAVLDDVQPATLAGERARDGKKGFGAFLLMLFGRSER